MTKNTTATPKTILPLCQTILAQQAEIYQRLRNLNQMLSLPPEPIEPKVREVLAPLASTIYASVDLTNAADLPGSTTKTPGPVADAEEGSSH